MSDEDSAHRKLSSFWPKSRYLVSEKRHEPTPTEAIIWKHLRQRQNEGLRFRRQHPIAEYIVDFYCPAAKLAIEIDGPIHALQPEADAIRQELIEALGIGFLRFAAAHVETNLPDVLIQIHNYLKQPQPASSFPEI